jgi:fructose 1,6-bisphosphate aldolase/phosphatase
VKVTLSVIKADIGGYVGHSTSHPDVLAKAEECLKAAKKDGLLIDYHVTNCGDDVQLIMTHKNGGTTKRFTSWPGIPFLRAQRSPRS